MDYPLLFSPDLKLTPKELAAAWNVIPKSCALTEALLSLAKGKEWRQLFSPK